MSSLRSSLIWATPLLLSLCDVAHGELCYIDSNTGTGVYCDLNCCGSNPTYCCDKDTFIIESAVFGSLGIFFILCMIVCCVYKKRKRDQKKAAMREVEKKMRTINKTQVAVVSSGSAGDGVVNEGFTAGDGGDSLSPPTLHSRSETKDVSLREIAPSTTPPPPGTMYNQQHYPPPATPTLPGVTQVNEAPR